jgi:hypothetical protein
MSIPKTVPFAGRIYHLIPDDMVLVPREPTDAIVGAGIARYCELEPGESGMVNEDTCDYMRQFYQAMIAEAEKSE